MNNPNFIDLSPGMTSFNPGGMDPLPLLTRPKKVAIVALGPSYLSFVQTMLGRGGEPEPWDEVWTVNRGLKGFFHDKLFVMDDLRWLLKTKDPAYGKWLQRHDRPIITSTAYPEFPNSIAYPYLDVAKFFQDDVFNRNTLAYMLAYAIMIGITDVFIYGADFFYPDGDKSEEGGQALAYLLGYLFHAGGKYHIPQTSNLLYAHKVNVHNGVMRREAYGYHRKAKEDKKEKPNVA